MQGLGTGTSIFWPMRRRIVFFVPAADMRRSRTTKPYPSPQVTGRLPRACASRASISSARPVVVRTSGRRRSTVATASRFSIVSLSAPSRRLACASRSSPSRSGGGMSCAPPRPFPAFVDLPLPPFALPPSPIASIQDRFRRGHQSIVFPSES
jgi:hypothetical protein